MSSFATKTDSQKRQKVPDIATRIKEARETAHLTQEELAKRVSFSKRTLIRYETGENEPGPGAIREIARVTNVAIRWLKTGEEPMQPYEGAEGQQDEDEGQPKDEEYSGMVGWRMKEAGAGPGRDNDGGMLWVDRRQISAALGYVPSKDNAFWVRVRGRSMEPWISNGAIVLAEVCHEVQEPDHYVFWQDGDDGHLIKYMERIGAGAIRVTQYGPEPRTDVYEHEADDVYRSEDGRNVRIVIKGRVVYPPMTAHSVLSTVTNELRKVLGR